MKTLHTIYSTFAKHNMAKFLTVLTILFTLGVGSVLGAALGDGYEKVTDISTLSAGDRVVLYCDAISLGVTGANSNGKDATVAASDWVEYLVESATGGVYLKDENASNYIASPGSSNVFKYGTKAVCSVNANGVLKCNDRYLCYNSNGGTYYRMYTSIGDYKPFYVYKVVTSTPIYNITVSSNDDSWGTANVSGNTITADPADCYQVKSGVDGYTIISGTATVTHEGNSNTLTVNASTDCSIQVNFEKKPVNTYIDNVQDYEEQELCGNHSAPSLTDKGPATTGTCEEQHWHFMGWVTEANKENLTDATNIVKANTSVTANGTTYYAVWAIGTTTGGGDTSKQYSFDITPSNFNSTSYAANNNEKTTKAKATDGSNATLDVKWTSDQVMLQSGNMQWQKNTGYIYNSTDLGTINSVTVTKSAGTFTTYYGTSERPSSGNAGNGKGYFKTSVGGDTGKTSKVTITFTKTTPGAQTTTYSDYITSCTTETTITLNPNGGTGNVITETTEETTYKVPPCSFTRTGYEFAKWNTKADGTGTDYEPDDEITLDGTTVNLYAIWTPIPYTITYELDGGTNHTSNPANYTIETATFSLQNPSKTGYTFGGWYKESTFATQVTQIANGSTGNITLYAKWTVNTHTLTWNVNGGDALTGTYTSGTVEYGATITPPDLPTRNGYVFTYWYDGRNMVEHNNLLKTMPDHDLTYTAQWEAVVYSISYQGLEGASNNANNPDTYTIESETITFLPPGERTGYKFTGWTPASIAKGSTGNKTVTANWTAKALVNYRTTCLPIYEVTLNPDGGTISDVEWVYNSSIGYYTKKVIEGYTVNLPLATKAGYTNTGWKTDPTTNVVTNPYTVTNNITLIAAYDCALATVGISGTYALTVGDVFELVATAYDSNGDVLTCPANTTYNWERYNSVDGVWEAITDDNSDGDNAKLTFNNCQIANCGTYRCHVTYGDCGAWSQGYNVHCFHLKGNFEDDWNKEYAFNHTDEEGIATLSMDLLTGQTFEFKIYDGITQYGNGGTIETSVTGWTYGTDNQSNTIFKTGADGTYIFKLDFKRLINSENILVLDVTYPPANQAEGHTIYYDNLVHNWQNVYYRIGHNRDNGDGTWGWNQNQKMTKVPGTSHLYTTKTPQFDNFEAWHIANNVSWADKNSIYLVNPDGTEYDITHATEYKKFVVVEDITLTPDADGTFVNGENCTYYPAAKQAGMKKHNATVIPATGGTITVSYTDHDGTAKSDFTSGDRDLAHTCLLTITATPDAGYSLGTLTVNDVPFTSGNVHTLSADAEIEVVWEKKIETALSWSAPTCTATIASPSNEFPTLTVTPEAIRAGVQYSSSIPAVATIDATGRIVLKSAGTTTIRAYYEEDNTYASAEDTYELIVEESTNCRWEEVTINDIEYGDEVVIAMQKIGSLGTPAYYALNSSKGTETYPPAEQLSIENQTIISNVSDPIIWNISGNATDGYVFYPNGSTATWLYCTGSNNTVKVGTGTAKAFYIENNYLKNTQKFTVGGVQVDAYVGVSISTYSWRHYPTTTGTSVIADQTLKFYKRVCLPEGQYWVKWMVNGQEYTVGNPTTKVVAGGQVVKLPTIPDDYQLPGCTSKKFIGWTTDEILVEADDAPTMFTDAASSPAISTNQTFHALFADVEEGETTYEKVTTISEGTYLMATITADQYKTKSTLAYTGKTVDNENRGGVVKVTISDGVIGVKPEAAKEITVTLGTEDDANYFAMFDGEYYITQTEKNKFTFASEVSYEWSLNANGQIKQKSVYDGKDDIRIYMNNGNSGAQTEYFCPYAAKSEGYNSGTYYYHAYLFKKIGGMSYSNYVTQCCTPWTAPTLLATTSIAVDGSTTITHSGTTHGAVTYTSSNTDIATVDANGVVTGVKPGKATITASWDGVDGSGNYCPAEATIDVTVTGSFTITYDANHASATGATTATTIAYPTGQGTVATNGFALAEHQFVKWNTSADGSGTSYSEGASITLTDDITLYAIWQRYCIITYVIHAGGGTLAAGATTTVVAGGAVQMPGIENNSIDLEYSCEELIGWTTNSATHEAAGLKPDPFYAIGASLSGITQNTTLYAVYSRAGNGVGGTVTLTAQEMEGWSVQQSYGTLRELVTCHGTWKTTGVKSTGNPIQLRATDNPYVEFPELQGNITQVVLNATNGSNATLTSGTFTLKTIDGQTTIASASVNNSGVCTLTVTGSYKTARLYSSVTARITNIAITYGPPAIISTTLDCSSDVDECTITYDLNESFLAAGTQILGSCHNSTFKFSEVGTYTICSEPQANEYKLIGWNNQCDGKGSLTFTPGQVISSLPQNIITLYAQWVPEVIVHDSYEETKVYPTEMGGSITLNPGQYICDPQKYEFIGWTTEDPQLWQQQNISPTLLEENQDGTVTFTPTEPSQVYAVYAIEDMANSDAFRLSSNVDGTTYYVGYDANRSGGVRARSNIEDALTFYKEILDADENKYLLYYIDPSEQDKEYLYYSGSSLSTSNNPSTNNYGWIFHTSGTGYKFQSIWDQTRYLSITSSGVQTNTTGSVFNIETIAEYKYVAKTNCSETVTITFVPGNGTMTPSTNPVTAKTGDVITLPTCEYEGWTFLGWVTENIEITEFQIEPSRLYNGHYEVGNSDITLYAYYTQIPESAEFDGTTSEVYKMYCEVDDKYYYAISHGSSSPGTLPSSNICLNAEEWVFTNTGESNVYYIQDHNNLYLTPEVNNTQLFFTSTPFPWKVVEIGTTNTYRIYAYNTRNDDYSRLIMFMSGAFYHSAKINEGNSAWHHVTIGGCQNPVYTTDPQPSKIISLVGSPMITSTIGQTVKASQKLQLVIKDMDANADVTIAADGLTFYDTDNNVVNNLQTGSNGSLTATFTVAYTPTVADNQIVNPTITVTCGSTVRTFYNVSCRSLPAEFVIAAKTGNSWVALTANITSTGTQAAPLIMVDNIALPTKATITPNTTKYQLLGLQTDKPSKDNSRFKNNGAAVHLYSTNVSKVISASTSTDNNKTYINADAAHEGAANSPNCLFYEWQLQTNDLVHYTLVNSNTTNTSNTKLGYSATYAQWGMYQTGNNVIQEVLLLPIEKDITEMDVEVMEWGTNSMALRFGSEAPATVDITLGATSTKGLSLTNLNSGNISDIYKVEGLTLTDNECKALLITDATDDSKGKLLRTPILVNGEKNGSDYTNSPTRDVCMHSDIVILNGGKLTADEAKSVGSHVDFANIYVYPGGKLVLDGKSLGVKRHVYLRGGYSWLNSTYALPEVYVNGDINFNGSGNMIYDYYIQNQKYYQFALPYDVQLANVTDESGADDFPVWVKHYNGALRAADAYATSWEWYPSENGDAYAYFEAGIGYIIAANPRQVGNVANRPLSIIRFPLGNSAFTGGEGDKSVVTTAHGIDGYKAGTVTANNVGWNFIGNPFMATWKGDIGHKELAKHPDEDNWDGSYHWVDSNFKYITIMSPEDGSDYAQTRADVADLKPFFPFYIQETADGGSGTINFAAANRVKKAPALWNVEQNEREAYIQIEIAMDAVADQTGVFVSNKYSDEIDFDDYEKMFGSSTDKPKVWLVHDNTRLAFEAMTENRATGMTPLGYRAPQDGEYMLVLNDEVSQLNNVESIYLTDYETGVTDYDLTSSAYEFESTTTLYNDTRFTIRIVMRDNTQGSITGIENIVEMSEHITKFIYQDKIYILHHGVIYDATGKRVITINK